MQALGSPTDSSYSSTDDIEAFEHSPNVEFSRGIAEDVVKSPLTILHDLTLAQEDVSRTRQDLLVERSKTRSTAEAVRLQRIVTGNVEGQLFSALRDVYNSNAGAFPPSVPEVYRRVTFERDRLGSIEDQYFEAERTLGGSEWRFMQKEGMLYQYQLPELLALLVPKLSTHDTRKAPHPPPPSDPVILGENTVLVHNAPPPPPPPQRLPLRSREPGNVATPSDITAVESDLESKIDNQYKLAVAELDSLRKEFDLLRPQQSELLEQEFGKRKNHIEASIHRVRTQEMFERYSVLLTKIAEKEVKVQHLRQKSSGVPDIGSDMSRRMSDEWMLNYAKTNPIQRNMYRNVLAEKEIPISDDDEWSERYWFTQQGQDSMEAADNQTQSSSSDTDHVVETTQINETSDVYNKRKTQLSSQSNPFSPLDRGFAESRDYHKYSGHFSRGAKKNGRADRYSDSATPLFSLTDLSITGHESGFSDQQYLKPFFHRRSKSTSAMSERRDITYMGGNFSIHSQCYPRGIPC